MGDRGRVRGHTGSNRVKRGGNFDNDAANVRASKRNNNTPSNANNNIGFRCCSSRFSQGVVSTDAAREHKVP